MKDHPILTSENFQKLLNWLDPDPDLAAQRYESIRSRLIRVFAGRGCNEAEDLADRTIDRVLVKIPKVLDTYVGDPNLYFLGVGRLVHLEWRRGELRRAETDFDRIRATEEQEPDRAGECLEDCLQSIPDRSRELILKYYRDEKRAKIDLRRSMADDLGITPSALQIRLHRIRKSLRVCVENCLDAAND